MPYFEFQWNTAPSKKGASELDKDVILPGEWVEEIPVKALYRRLPQCFYGGCPHLKNSISHLFKHLNLYLYISVAKQEVVGHSYATGKSLKVEIKMDGHTQTLNGSPTVSEIPFPPHLSDVSIWRAVADDFLNFPKHTMQQACPPVTASSKVWGGKKVARVWASLFF